MATRRSSPARAVVAGGAAVVVLAGGGVAWAATRSSGPTYRLAPVTRSNVAQTITEVGAISSINQRSVSFPVSGTVASVKVALGDTVAAGQTLAALDNTNLEAQVVSDNGSLASAKQRLADDETAQAAADSTAAYSETQLGVATASSPTHSGGASVTQLQSAVVADQKAVDAGLATITADLATVTSACSTSTVTFTATSDASGIIQGTVAGAAGLPISIPSDTDAAGNPIPATTVAAGGTYTFGTAAAPLRANASYTIQLGDDTAGVSATTTCQGALTATQNDERTESQAERKLAADEQSLDAAVLASASSTGGGTGSGTGSGSGTGGGTGGGTGSAKTKSTSGSTGSAGTGSTTGGSTGGSGTSSGSGASSGSSGSSGGTVTAAQLAADQKSIDAAAAELVVAQQNLAAATLVAPIAGTVANVGISSGSGVSASSSTSTITIIGTGQKEVTTTVGIADIDLVKIGETASVTVDGVSHALPGKVTQVGILNTSGTSGDTTTYPVTIVLDPTALALYDGAGATVGIDVGTVQNVLTVPSSALTTVGTRAIVLVYSKGTEVRTVVTTGISGVDRTEIKSGLTAGQQVVLADLHAAIPTSNSNSTTSRFAARLGGAGAGGLSSLVTSGTGTGSGTGTRRGGG